MSRILVAYATGEGQTAKVARYVSAAVEERGHETTLVDVVAGVDSVDVTGFDAVVIGASIHAGAHQTAAVDFVSEHRDVLARRPSGFFQVSLSSASDDPARRAEAEGYVDSFRETTGWTPDAVGTFAGALRYSEYGFFKRLLLKRIAKTATGDTDVSRDYEYTDWTAVDAFVDAFLASADADVPPEAVAE